MEILFQQVRRAQRRIFVQQFLSALVVCWGVALLIALAAIAAPKLWAMPFAGEAWAFGWLGGALAIGLCCAFGWCWWHRRDNLAAALEIDRRFGLKERVSSSLALAPDDLDSEAGRALLTDALRRIGKLEVKDKFDVAPGHRAWVPVGLAAAALGLVLFVSDKLPENIANATATARTQPAEAVKESTESLRKKIEERRQQAKEQGLQDAEELFKKVEEGIKDLSKKETVEKKEALLKLNDLAKQLEDRKRQLGGDDKIKQQLDQLKDLQKGPADKVAQALKNGDFQKAKQELDELKKKLDNGKLDGEQKEELAKQMDAMQDKLQQMANAKEQAKQDLQQQIQQQQAAGNTGAAAQLQQQLDNLQQQSSGINQQLPQMAQQLKQASQALKDGDPAGAQQAMDQLSQSLSQMQKQQSELQTLEGALDQISQAKDQMSCDKCSGKGCEKCKGGHGGEMEGGGGPGGKDKSELAQGGRPGQGDSNGDQPAGDSPGGGRAVGAQGKRPENANDTKLFDTKVNQNVGKGAALLTDFVDGPNVKGRVLEQIKEQAASAKRETSDPLTGQRLPKEHKDHAREYFDALREGK